MRDKIKNKNLFLPFVAAGYYKSNKFNRLKIKVFFILNISPPNIGPSNLLFFCIRGHINSFMMEAVII